MLIYATTGRLIFSRMGSIPGARRHGSPRACSRIWPRCELGLLAAIHELSAPGSVLAFDRIVGDATAGGRLERLSARSRIRMDRLLAGGDAADLEGFLARSGWAVDVEPVKALASRYGRDLTDPFGGDDEITAEPPWLETVFISAVLG